MASPADNQPRPREGQIRVAVVDDHELVRAGVRSALSLSPDMLVVGEAGDGLVALELLDRETVDVVLLDLHMPRMDGLSCLDHIRSRWPQLPVIVLTVDEDREVALQAIRHGAAAYVPKFVRPGDLASLIRQVVCGVVLVGGDALAQLLAEGSGDHAETSSPPTHYSLTDRELEILGLLAEGKSNADIAHTLFVSTKTVKYHLTNIFSKLQVRNRTEAAALALKQGLVDKSGAGPEA